MSIYNIQITSQDVNTVTFTFAGTGVSGGGFTMYVRPWDGSSYGTAEAQTLSFGASETNTSGASITGLSLVEGSNYRLNTESGAGYGTVSATFTAAAADSGLSSIVSGTVGSGGGAVLAGGTTAAPEAKVNIPSSALSENVTIKVDLSAASNPMSNGVARALGSKADKFSRVISLSPHGQAFDSPVTLEFLLTGSVSGSVPGNLKIFKSNESTGTWYELPAQYWSIATGTVTLSTTTFSRYQAIGGNSNMGITTVKGQQLAKLTQNNKALAKAIDITGSSAAGGAIHKDYAFIAQADGSDTVAVSASVMADFFSSLDVTGASDNRNYRVAFVNPEDNSDVKIAVDNDSGLMFNPSTDALTVDGTISGSLVHSAGAVSGAGEFSAGSLVVIGATYLTGAVVTTGKVGVGGVLDVTGAADFRSSVDIYGAAKLKGAVTLGDAGSDVITSTGQITASNGIQISAGTLDCNVSASFASTVGITGDAELLGALDVAGATTLNGTVTLGDAGTDVITSTGKLSASAGLAVTAGDSFTVAAAVPATFSGKLTGSNGIDITGHAELNSTLNVDGTAVFVSDVTASANMLVSGDLFVAGTTVTVDAENLTIYDPIITLGSSSAAAGSPAVGDRGFIFDISGSAKAFIWDNSASEFALAAVPDDIHGTGSQIDIDSYADLAVGALSGSGAAEFLSLTLVNAATIEGALSVDGALSANGAVTLGNAETDVITSTGRLTASAGLAIAGGDSFTVAASVPATFSGKLTGSNGIDITGHADFNSSLTVDGVLLAHGNVTLGNAGTDVITSTGKLSASAGLAITAGDSFTVAAAVPATFSGKLTGSNGIDITGHADFNSSLTVDGDILAHGAVTLGNAGTDVITSTGQMTASNGIQVAGGALDCNVSASFASTVGITGNTELLAGLDVAGATTLNGTVTLGDAATDVTTVTGKLTASSGIDATGVIHLHAASASVNVASDFMYFKEVDGTNEVKQQTVATFLSASCGAGLQITNGVFSITSVEDVVSSHNPDKGSTRLLTLDRHTASLSTQPLTSSVQVYLNGLLQVASGSHGISGSTVSGGVTGSIFDYYYSGLDSALKVVFPIAIDEGDVVQIRYLKK
jgi:propanediol utilization protein